MRIPSGITDRYIYFVAVDVTDMHTRETGLSSFTVYRSRNGGAAAEIGGATINETDSTNMPGVYELLLNSDMTLDAGDDTQEMVFHISHSGMASVTRVIELYRPETTEGATLGVTSGVGAADVVEISGDATAADNLEATFDGGGYNDPKAPARQEQVSNIVATGSALNVTAESAVVTTGSTTNDVTATTAHDQTYHQIARAGVGDAIDLYYQFDVEADGVPTSVNIHGRLNFSAGGSQTIDLFAWNWDTPGWEQIGVLNGIRNSGSGDDTTYTYTLFTQYVGTGGDLGKVRIKFEETGMATGSELFVDQIFASYAVVRRTVGYIDGAIWVDTIGGTAGTTNDKNGAADLPCLTWADALILSASKGLKKFHIANGSTITLSASTDNCTLYGAHWTLDLSGESIAEAVFTGAHVFGIGTGGGSDFHHCYLADGGTLTIAQADFHRCALAGSIVLTAAATYYFDQCYSGVAGTSTPDLDVGAAVGSTNVNFRHYSGGIEIENFGRVGTDLMSLEGHGQLVLNANCTGGTIAIRGHFTVTDNASGVVALSDDARYDVDQVTAGADAATTVSLHSDYDEAKTAAQAGDAMTLAEDSIKAITYDQSTAYPVVDPDSGDTRILRTGEVADLTGSMTAWAYGDLYAVRSDIEELFGVAELKKWADREGTQDGSEIAAAIASALSDATEYVNDRLRGGRYDLPFAPIPPMIKDITRRRAATMLYEWRGATDYDAKGAPLDRLTVHRKWVEDMLNKLRAGVIRLDATSVGGASYPHVVTIPMHRDRKTGQQWTKGI